MFKKQINPVCRVCGDILTGQNFSIKTRKTKGLICKKCWSKGVRDRRYKNPKRARELEAIWRKRNPNKVREYAIRHRQEKNDNAKKRLLKFRLEILSLLGNKCVQCEESDFRCLQIDHVNGYGSKDRKTVSAGIPYYIYLIKKIKNGSKDYQILCANCNWKKKYDNREVGLYAN
jgi:hypothetical protein